MNDRLKQFQEYLKPFPQAVREVLSAIPAQGGRLSASQCVQLTQSLGINAEELMCRLLPLARIFAVAPISHFRVGAVAKTGSRDTHRYELYLGANIEFLHHPLNQSIHAEQSATMNAWHQGAQRLYALAVSEPPCGHCRQFLHEFEINPAMPVIVPSPKAQTLHKQTISDLLPGAMCPSDLGNRSVLMAGAEPLHKLHLEVSVKDRVITEALMAAQRSYAPYSKNYAGCAVETGDGKIYTGRSVESAAYNPRLTPLHTVMVCMNMAVPEEKFNLRRVVLVERRTSVSQQRTVAMLLASWMPGVAFEYYQAS